MARMRPVPGTAWPGAVLRVSCVGGLLLGLQPAVESRADQPAPSDSAPALRGEIDYAALDRAARATEGLAFHEYMTQIDEVGDFLDGEADLRRRFDRYITSFRIGDNAAELALYTAFAREARFEERADGCLEIASFSGMNVPHAVVAAMFDEFLDDVAVDEPGGLSGTGRVAIPVDGHDSPASIEVDFGRDDVRPCLFVTNELGGSRAVTADDVETFVSWYTDDRGEDRPLLVRRDGDWQTADNGPGGPTALNLFAQMTDLPTIRHEMLHALFRNAADFRASIVESARRSNREQREMAVLFTAINYWILDSGIEQINPDIVLDETYNAYSLEGDYDIETGRSRFSAGEFARTYDIRLSLDAFESIDALPATPAEKDAIRALHEAAAEGDPELSERAFLRGHSTRILDNIGSMSLLRRLLREQHPAFYESVERARAALVDDRL